MKIITISGNVGRDAELKKTPNGISVSNFTVAVNGKGKRKKETTWFDVSIWDKRAEALTPYIKAGNQITVIGDLIHHEHNERFYLKVTASELELHGRSGLSSDDIQDQADQMEYDDPSDVPF